MRSFRLGIVCLALGIASFAHAQAVRTFVASTGDDANPCNVALPCRNFQAALALTADKGEILALDTAGFGQVTINKSVTIDGGSGNRSSMGGSLTVPVTISDPFNAIVVTIRNVAINGVGGGSDGVRFLSGKRLILDRVSIAGFSGKGIVVNTPNQAYLTMKDVTVEDTAGIGIDVSPSGGSILVLNAKNLRVSESNLNSGMYLNGNIRATIIDSEFVNCPNGAGIAINSTAQVALDHVIATSNKWGVWNFGGSPVTRLKDCLLIGNTFEGALRSAGLMTAYQSNVIDSSSGVTSIPPM